MDELLDSDRLQTFVTVARERGFSRAARRLGKTQPSVSQAVALLERQLGERLFVREGRQSRLTDAGRVLLEHAERILTEMTAVRSRLTARGELREGRLTIGASDTLACYFLPPVFAAFRARYPGVELRLVNRPSPATALAVAEGGVDLGVVTLPLAARDPRLQLDPLAPHEDVAICPPAHPLARRRRAPWTALAPYPLLLLDRSTASRAFIDAELRGAAKVAMEMSSVEVLKRLVELGFGVSVVPAMAVERERKAGTLATVALPRDDRRAVALVTAAGAVPRAAVAFAAMARQHCKRRAR